MRAYNHSTCVKQRKYWASEIEWMVVRHSRVKMKEKKEKKIKGCFERVRLRVASGR